MFEQLRASIRKGKEHKRNRQMTRAEFEAARLLRFREFARFVNAKSPYYAKLIRERNINIDTCLPTDFPPLTKTLLMKNFDDIVTDRNITRAGIADFLTRSKNPLDRYRDRYTVIHTSGSSGEVGYFVYSPSDLGAGLSMGRGRDRIPKRRTKRGGRYRIAFFGAADGHYAGVTMMSMMRRFPAKLFIDVGVFEVNSPLPGVIEGLNKFQPDVLVGYTTALKILAEKQRAGTMELAPVLIVTSGEATTSSDKEVLTGTFGAAVVNGYGCSEHLSLGGSRPGSEEIVIYDDDLIMEIQPDHTLVTNLFNHTLPLIRYRMNDTLRPVANHDNAPYMAIESLVGRNEIQPVFKNRDGAEDFISPHTINEIFVKGVTRFQLQLVNETSFNFRICMESTLTPQERETCRNAVDHRLREILSRKHMDNVTFQVLEVDDLPVSPVTRKFQLIVRE